MTMVEIETGIEIEEVEISKETEVLKMAEEISGNKIQDRVLETVLGLEDKVATEIEMANGIQEAGQDLLADLTPTNLEVDNHGMRKSREVDQAQKIREEERTGVDLDLVLMID